MSSPFQGYKCPLCGFRFRFNLTGPVTKCPECGALLNSKAKHGICRFVRAMAGAFLVLMLTFFTGYSLLREQGSGATLLAAGGLGFVAFAVFFYFQLWSLVVVRLIERGVICLLLALVIVYPVMYAIGWFNLYKADSPTIVILALGLGGVMLLASTLIFKVTSDYSVAEEPRPEMPEVTKIFL